jgi:putative DNA primase/helicase
MVIAAHAADRQAETAATDENSAPVRTLLPSETVIRFPKPIHIPALGIKVAPGNYVVDQQRAQCLYDRLKAIAAVMRYYLRRRAEQQAEIAQLRAEIARLNTEAAASGTRERDPANDAGADEPAPTLGERTNTSKTRQAAHRHDEFDADRLKREIDIVALIGKDTRLVKNGNEYVGLCPLPGHKEKTPSLNVNPSKRAFHCFGCGRGGSVIDYVMEMQSLSSVNEACKWLRGSNIVPLHRHEPTVAPEPADPYAGYVPVDPPADATELFQVGVETPRILNIKRSHEQGRQVWGSFTPSHVAAYRDATGKLIGFVLRHDFVADGKRKKETPAIQYVQTPDGELLWARMHFSEPRPLYGLDRLAKTPECRVLAHEGEKKTDAAEGAFASAGQVNITWPGGAGAVDKADWSPVRGHNVMFWPDCDLAGYQAVLGSQGKNGKWNKGGAELALDAGAPTVAMINVIDPGQDGFVPTKEGWDAADAVETGWDFDRTKAWIAQRKIVFTTVEEVCEAAQRLLPKIKALFAKPEPTPTSAEPEHPMAEPTAPVPIDLRVAKGIAAMGGEHELSDEERAALDADRAERAKKPQTTGPMLEPGTKAPSQRDQLLIVADGADFWRCPDGDAYASVPIDDHIEHHRVRSAGFRNWLIVEAGKAFQIMMAGRLRPGGFSKNAIEEALTSCEATAVVNGTVHKAPLRVAANEDAIYIDLGSPNWEVVEVDANGWRILSSSPVPILRTRRTRPLPRPVTGGSLADLRGLMQLDDQKYDDDWTLIVLWLLAAMRPHGPYPMLPFSGEQGAGKSAKARMIRRLVDPCGDDIMQPPGDDDDLIAAARNNHVLCFDNMSSISGELADSLCRLATGGDIGGRQLYTDNASAAFAAQRPIIINGIPDLATRGDLASRSIFIRLDQMKKRLTEEKLWRMFAEKAPGIFGALLDVLSAAMRRLPDMELPGDASIYRMADFALLAQAAEPALGLSEGAALAAYRNNILGATEVLAKTDSVAVAITALINQDGRFDGLVTSLLNRLNNNVSLDTRHSSAWPKSASVLGGHLRRIAPAMRANGLSIEFPRKSAGSWVEIAPHVGGVGNVGDTSTLSLLREKKREMAPGAANGGGQTASQGHADKLREMPTPPTLSAENGGNPRLSACRHSVGSVGDVGDRSTGTHDAAADICENSAAECRECRQSVGVHAGDFDADVGVDIASGEELPL